MSLVTLIKNFRAPALPLATKDYNEQATNQMANILRLYFNQIDQLTEQLTTRSAIPPNPRVNSQTSVSTLVWDSANYDQYVITALAVPLTINADSNSAPADGQKIMFRFKDSGTARALTWTVAGTNSFRVVGTTLPTTTVANKLIYVGCIYNAASSLWDVVAVGQQV
jgi:hypothetical protein